jgi:hypothetical protein
VSFGNPQPTPGTSTFDAVQAQVARLNIELEARGRTPSSLRRILLNFMGDELPMSSFEAFLDWAGRYRELGFDEVVVTWPVADTVFDYDAALFERICREGGPTLGSWE